MNGAYRGRDAPPTSIEDKSPNSKSKTLGTETLSVQLRKSYMIQVGNNWKIGENGVGSVDLRSLPHFCVCPTIMPDQGLR